MNGLYAGSTGSRSVPLRMLVSRAAGGALLWLAAASGSAAVIDFGTLGLGNLVPLAPTNFGSTALVNVSYRTFDSTAGFPTNAADPQVYVWSNDYGGLSRVVYASQGLGGLEIRLTAVNATVTLNSFSIGSYGSLAREATLLRVVDTGTNAVLWDNGGTLSVSSTASRAPNVSSTTGLALQLGFNNSLGINLIDFDARPLLTSVVPVPPALALFGGGVALLGWRARRHAV